MTVDTLIPFIFMRSAIYREIHVIVIKSRRYPGCFAVAILASRRESGRSVIWVVRLVVFRLVATDAGIWGIIIVSVVAGIAIVGNGSMRTIQGIKTVVVESRRYPSCFAVAAGAVCGQLLRGVVGVGSLVVIANMTAHTGIRSVIVIPVMASGAVIGYDSMRAVQGVIIVVDRKGGRRPTGVCGMATRAIRRNGQGHVVRVGALVVIRRMAACAGVRRVCIIAVVTNITIIRDGGMRSRERIKTIVVQCRRYPGRFAVAAGAVRRELLGGVVGVGCLVVIADMATRAGIRGVIVIPIVAGDAVIGNGGMRAV